MSMKYVFQLVQKDNGNRTQPFVMTRVKLAKELKATHGDNDDYYVLVLADVPVEGDLVFSQAPLMLGTTFISNFWSDTDE